HYCGIFSHKSTHGLVSLAGHGIASDDPAPDINVAGPLARSARDLEIILRVLADDATPLAAPRPAPLADSRVAVLPTHPLAPVDGGVASVIEALGRDLERVGASVAWNAVPDIDAAELWRTYVLMLRAATSIYADDAAYEALRARAGAVDPRDDSYAALQYRGAALDHRAWLQLAQARRRFARRRGRARSARQHLRRAAIPRRRPGSPRLAGVGPAARALRARLGCLLRAPRRAVVPGRRHRRLPARRGGRTLAADADGEWPA